MDKLVDGFAREHYWVRVRLLGWILIGAWQAFDLVADFVPIMLDNRPLKMVRDATGLVGLILVAWGFERVVAEAHRRQGETHGRPSPAKIQP